MTTEKAFPVELWDVERLIPYEKNAKKHDPESVKRLARSIKEFGWDQPIVVDSDGIIVKGHGRRLAAIELGLKKVPVIVRSDLTKAQADALRLSDNQVVSTDYDMTMIQDELRRLSEENIDLTALGFDEKELDFSLSSLGDINENFFVEDVGDAVEKQKERNDKAAQDVDDVAAPVVDALGFKRVTIAQSRMIREFMTSIETRTGKTGVDAFIDFIGAAL